mmetsp:Transcript_32573/g.68386  ORF Transcript_32573/g.68386 Transcript_32573/m.68386 type:complete len:93 (+) Transcript_32573:204-482(+)
MHRKRGTKKATGVLHLHRQAEKTPRNPTSLLTFFKKRFRESFNFEIRFIPPPATGHLPAQATRLLSTFFVPSTSLTAKACWLTISPHFHFET